MNRFLISILLFHFYGTDLTARSSVIGHPSTIIPPQSSVIGHRSTVIRHRSTVIGQRSSDLNRPAFYKAMEENNKALVNAQLSELEFAPEGQRQAFMGAMLMKKAGFHAPPAIKLRLFKQGNKMLESAIKQDPENAEFRFLRLIVQEHAPGVLGYKNDVQKDCEYIRKYYKSLPDEVQQVIANYSKKSKFLKLEVS